MRWLTEFRARRRERGATAVVAALVISFIALPALALSVDMGSIMFERRQLQNGTDAASMALAQTCADSAVACNATTTLAALNALASANAIDNASQLNTAMGTNGQCVRPPTGVTYTSMPTCASATASAVQRSADLKNIGVCPPLSDYYVSGAGKDLGYVETYVQTKSSAADNTILPNIFSKAAAGGTRDTACARAAWGPGAPSSNIVLSLTMSECDWAAQTGYPATSNYAAAPSGAWPGYSNTDDRPDWPTVEHAVWSKDNPIPNCDTSSSGGTAPGGFAWLTGAACKTTTTEGWIQTDPGANAECTQDELTNLRGKVVYIPVFDCRANAPTNPIPALPANFCTQSNGSNTYYHISGFAAFYLSGWFLGNNAASKMESIAPPAGRYLCSGSGRCLFGWFTKALIPEGDFTFGSTSDPNYGFTIVKPAG